MPLAARTILRWCPPLALAALAIASIVRTTRELPERVAHTPRPPVLDWNDAGAFVVDARGVPIAGAHVAAIPRRAWVTEPEVVLTDANGHFQLAVSTVYDLSISVDPADTLTRPPRLFARVLAVAPPFFGQRFVAAPATRYAVRVEDDYGEPLRFLPIELRVRGSSAEIDATFFGPVWGARATDEHGDLVVWSVPGVAVDFLRYTDAALSRHRSIDLASLYGKLVFGPVLSPLVVER